MVLDARTNGDDTGVSVGAGNTDSGVGSASVADSVCVITCSTVAVGRGSVTVSTVLVAATVVASVVVVSALVGVIIVVSVTIVVGVDVGSASVAVAVGSIVAGNAVAAATVATPLLLVVDLRSGEMG